MVGIKKVGWEKETKVRQTKLDEKVGWEVNKKLDGRKSDGESRIKGGNKVRRESRMEGTDRNKDRHKKFRCESDTNKVG